ncbi:uncharacterized protein VICG_01747 [Vittaforma corneae ATCC 50505]|uniref:Uncharacterized protein n=1 Tax=Vittaforma corneae (strain ATCC 50505) TaxID=993615 RepID=L2GK49_VITCO|nr:uncharacterized protein VICG_01747 [Vittaforma corneae ATCC 50505]ELA41258.1 hypothetical protein VICG_01747 [Vittaforma corneae ATCC 50505]
MFIMFNPLELLLTMACVYANMYNNCAGLNYSANQIADMSKMLSSGQYCTNTTPSNEMGFLPPTSPSGPGYCANQGATPCATGGGSSSGYYPQNGNTTNIPGMTSSQAQECSVVTSVECGPKQSGNNSLVPQRFTPSQSSTDYSNQSCNQQSTGGGGFIPGLYPGDGSSGNGGACYSQSSTRPDQSNSLIGYSQPCSSYQNGSGSFVPGNSPIGYSQPCSSYQNGSGSFVPGNNSIGYSQPCSSYQNGSGSFVPGNSPIGYSQPSACSSYQNGGGFSGLFDCSNPSFGKTPINTAYIGTTELPVVPGFTINPSSCSSSSACCTPSAQ